jgi:hypothetical protein
MKKFLNRFECDYGLFIGIGLGYDREEEVIFIALPFLGAGVHIGKIGKPTKLNKNV